MEGGGGQYLNELAIYPRTFVCKEPWVRKGLLNLRNIQIVSASYEAKVE